MGIFIKVLENLLPAHKIFLHCRPHPFSFILVSVSSIGPCLLPPVPPILSFHLSALTANGPPKPSPPKPPPPVPIPSLSVPPVSLSLLRAPLLLPVNT